MTNIYKLSKRFDTKEKCIKYFEKLRFPAGVYCSRCGSLSISRIKTRFKYECNDCHYQFSVTSGTILHKTHLPLSKWILASFLICNARKGISAKQIQRDLQLTYKTAWFLMHRIRKAMQSDPLISKFKNIVEVDETYIGGKAKGIRGRGAKNKSIVLGISERNGSVKFSILKNLKHSTLAKEIEKYVDPNIKMLCADEFPSYNRFARKFNLCRIDHSSKKYVNGNVHTNSVESMWALLKRGIHGSYHHVSKKYLALYLNEFEYRFNNNGDEFLFERIIKNGLKPLSA